MAKVIETTKGVFLVLDKDELKFKEKRGILHVYHYNCLVDWIHRFKLSEITEEEASKIVDYRFECRNIGNYPPCKTALKKILQKNNIEITDNTYIFKL